MTALISLVLIDIVIVFILLFVIARQNRNLITTAVIIATLFLGVLFALVNYSMSGYPRDIHFFNEKWILLSYETGENNVIYLFVRDPGERTPKLLAFNFRNKEEFEKHKERLKNAKSKMQDGIQQIGRFNVKTNDFSFENLNLSDFHKKDDK